MYYAFNLASWFFTIVAIALVYDETVSPWVVLTLLLSAACFQLVSSVYVVLTHDELEERVKKLKNKKDEK